MEQYFRNRASVDDDPDLARNRRANDARLKSRFEHIFTKYGRNFDGVGDEIDLNTGEIIVNNGHVERMRHEVDPGKGVSSQVLQVLGGGLNNRRGGAAEDSLEEWEDDDESSASGYSSSEDANDFDNDRAQRNPYPVHDELSSDVFPPEDDEPLDAGETTQESRGRTPSGIDEVTNSRTARSSREASRNAPPGNRLANLPSLQDSFRDSMEAIRVKPGQHRAPIGQDAIEALGRSIADQLARFMNGNSKVSRKKKKSGSRKDTSDSRWQYPVLPGDRAGRTPSPPPPASPSAALFMASPDGEASIWAPQQARRQRKRQKSRLHNQISADGSLDGLSAPIALNHVDADREATNDFAPDCYNCGTSDSISWRRGPGGLLCNPCGSYFHKYGLEKRIEDRAGIGTRSSTVSAPRRSHPGDREPDVYDVPVTSTPAAMTMYTANTARRITGDAHKAPLTIEEEENIIKLREVDRMTWEEIASSMSNQSAYRVQSHYSELVSRPDCEARRRLLERGMPVEQKSAEMGYDASTPTRDQPQETVPPNRSHIVPEALMYGGDSDSDSDPKRGGQRRTYTKSEDQAIIHMREVDGLTWKEIGDSFPDRTLLALKTHYSLHLRDRSSLPQSESSRKPYTPEEDERIISMKDQNMEFAEIAQHFPGRSAGGIAQRYKGVLKSRMPGLHRLPTQTAARTDTIDPALEASDHAASDAALADDDARTRMPPPPVPGRVPAQEDNSTAATPSRVVEHRISGRTPRAEQQRKPSPQTPLVVIPSYGLPPQPPEVGPSAWTSTQPASKGPLPFQPARKRLPLVQKGSRPVETANPFLSLMASFATSSQRRSKSNSTVSPDKNAANLHSEPIHMPTRRSSSKQSSQESPEARVIDRVGDTHRQAVPPIDGYATIERLGATTNSVVEAPHGISSMEEEDTSSDFDSGENQTTVSFTPQQDSFIRLCREKHKMNWSDIAENMPGDSVHTVQAVTDRYYDVIMNKPAGAKARKSAKGAELDWKRGQRYSDEESMKVVQLRNQGLGWTKMAQFMPGRSPKSLQNYHYQYSTRQPSPQPNAAGARRTSVAAPLLRQALDNSTRRPSNSLDARKDASQTLSSAAATGETAANFTRWPQSEGRQASQITQQVAERHATSPDRGASEEDAMEVVDDNFLQGMQHYLSNPESAAADGHGDMVSGRSNAVQHQHQPSLPPPQDMPHMAVELLRSKASSIAGAKRSNPSEENVSAYEELNVHGGADDYEDPVPSHEYAAVYDTPAKSNRGSMPYFLAPNHNLTGKRTPTRGLFGYGDPDPPPEEEDIAYETHRDEPSADSTNVFELADPELPASNNSAVHTDAHTATKPGRREIAPAVGTKRKRSQVPSKRVSDFEVADSDSDSPYVDDEDEGSENATHITGSEHDVAPPKRYRPRSTTSSHRIRQETFGNDMENEDRNARAEQEGKRHSNVGSSGGSRRRVAQPAEPEKDRGTHANEAHQRPKRPRRSDAHVEDQRANASERKPDLQEPHSISQITVSANGVVEGQKANRGRKPKPPPAGLSKNGDAALVSPDLDWVAVVATAIRSSPDQCMAGKEILRWVRDSYPYYRTSQEPWPFRVHNALRRNPLFVRVARDNRKAVYTLADKGQQTSPAKHARDSPEDADMNDGSDDIFYEGDQQSSAGLVQNSSAEEDSNDNVNDQTTARLSAHVSPIPQPAHTATNAPEVITISSDPPIKPEPVSKGSIAVQSKGPGDIQQPTPRSKALRKSDTTLIRRAPSLATPARSSTHMSSLLTRSAMSNRSEMLSRTADRDTPVTLTGLGERRVLFARDVRPEEEDGEIDELS